MQKTDSVRVEMVATVSRQGLPGASGIDRTSTGSVEGVSCERLARRREVDADLMGATRQDSDFEQRATVVEVSVKHPAFRGGRSTFGVGGVKVVDSRVSDASNGRLYLKRLASGDPTRQRPVDLRDSALTQVLG
jgi:hypothetical protein